MAGDVAAGAINSPETSLDTHPYPSTHELAQYIELALDAAMGRIATTRAWPGRPPSRCDLQPGHDKSGPGDGFAPRRHRLNPPSALATQLAALAARSADAQAYGGSLAVARQGLTPENSTRRPTQINIAKLNAGPVKVTIPIAEWLALAVDTEAWIGEATVLLAAKLRAQDGTADHRGRAGGTAAEAPRGATSADIDAAGTPAVDDWDISAAACSLWLASVFVGYSSSLASHAPHALATSHVLIPPSAVWSDPTCGGSGVGAVPSSNSPRRTMSQPAHNAPAKAHFHLPLALWGSRLDRSLVQCSQSFALDAFRRAQASALCLLHDLDPSAVAAADPPDVAAVYGTVPIPINGWTTGTVNVLSRPVATVITTSPSGGNWTSAGSCPGASSGANSAAGDPEHAGASADVTVLRAAAAVQCSPKGAMQPAMDAIYTAAGSAAACVTVEREGAGRWGGVLNEPHSTDTSLALQNGARDRLNDNDDRYDDRRPRMPDAVGVMSATDDVASVDLDQQVQRASVGLEGYYASSAPVSAADEQLAIWALHQMVALSPKKRAAMWLAATAELMQRFASGEPFGPTPLHEESPHVPAPAP